MTNELKEVNDLTELASPDGGALVPIWQAGVLYHVRFGAFGGGGGGGGGHVIESNGSPLTQRANLNVTGLLQVSDSGGKTVLTLLAINLASQVTGVLPIANGGIGLSTPGTPGQSIRYNSGGLFEAYTPSAGLNAPASPADNGKVAVANAGNLSYSLLNTAHLASNAAITLSQLASLSADRLVGADAAGVPVELTVSGGLEFTGSNGIQRSALTGDVTASAGSGATSISNLARSKIAGALLQGSNLTNADQTLTVADGCEFTMPAGTTSANRDKTLDDAGAVAGQRMVFYINAQGNNVVFKNTGSISNTLYTVTAGAKLLLVFEFDGLNWGAPGIGVLA